MAKCPQCGGEIVELKLYRKQEKRFAVGLDETGQLHEQYLYTTEGGEVPDDYECPWCDVLLFHTAKEALEFLTERG